MWKASLLFHAPSRNNSISRHLNLTKSSYLPHKPTRCIPQGYYSNWVTLISLYIFWLPLQSPIIYSALLCIPARLAPAQMCSSCSCPHVLHFYKLSKQQDLFTPLPYCELIQVVGGFLPTSRIFACPSVDHLNCQTGGGGGAPLRCNLYKWYSLFVSWLDV